MKKEKRIRKNKKVEMAQEIERYFPTLESGLSPEQVSERQLLKLTNSSKTKTSKSYLAIIAKNLFTFFNFLWAIIAVALLIVGSYRDLLFIFVVIANKIGRAHV